MRILPLLRSRHNIYPLLYEGEGNSWIQVPSKIHYRFSLSAFQLQKKSGNFEVIIHNWIPQWHSTHEHTSRGSDTSDRFGMKPSNLTHWCLLHLPTLPSFQKLYLYILLFGVLFLLNHLTYSLTDLLTYLLTDLVTYLHAWCQENNCILYKRFILKEKSSLHLISLNPTLRKNPFLPPKKQLFENKGGGKKRSPNLYTEKPLWRD